MLIGNVEQLQINDFRDDITQCINIYKSVNFT